MNAGPLAWVRAARRGVRRFAHALRFHADAYVGEPPAWVEERWLTTRDGVRLHAWYAAAPHAIATLLWSHGNGVGMARRPDLLSALAARGLAVLAYDYRGCGRSGGRPRSERGLHLDALAAYESERARGVPAARLIAAGDSLGGAVAIRLGCARPCAGVVAVSTFTRLRDVRAGYGALALVARFDALRRVRRLTVPILVAHGDRDRMIGFELGERLFAAAHEPKAFLRVAGAGHDDVLASPGLLDTIAQFAARVTSRAQAAA